MNCKHGIEVRTCAYCTGLITKASANIGEPGSQSGFYVSDYNTGFHGTVVLATGFRLNKGKYDDE